MPKAIFFLGLLLYCLKSISLQAQDYRLLLQNTDRDSIETRSFKSQVALWSYLREFQTKQQQNGYLTASIDSVWAEDEFHYHAISYQGDVYQWGQIDLSDLPLVLQNQLPFKFQSGNNANRVTPMELQQLHETILDYCEQNGYPFAYTYFDQIKEEKLPHQSVGVTAKLRLEPGPIQRIDTIILQGDADISLDYLQNYLSIHPGDLYNKKSLQQISKRLKALAFLESTQDWRLNFTLSKNKLYLYLDRKKANQINGLIGLQPNTEASGKFLLTADFLLGLQNSLGYGEIIDLSYRNLQAQSPQFHSRIMAPYVLGSLFGIEGGFDLYKKDSLYRKVRFDLGLSYQLDAENTFRLFYERKSNRLITPDTHFVATHQELPSQADVQADGLGLSFETERTDYKFNPHQGWRAAIQTVLAKQKVLKNDAILSLHEAGGYDYNQLYEKANEAPWQYRIEGSVACFIPLFKHITTKVAYQGAFIQSQPLFQNQLYQIGGFRTLRGFDEFLFYANQYHIATFELRFLIGRNDYFYLFNDNGWVQTKFADFNQTDVPIGIGVGANLQTTAGLFNLAIGLGKHYHRPFEFNHTKIHFGYAAFF